MRRNGVERRRQANIGLGEDVMSVAKRRTRCDSLAMIPCGKLEIVTFLSG